MRGRNYTRVRIPDIYENHGNQLAFAGFLDKCPCCDDGEWLLAAIRALDERRIKVDAIALGRFSEEAPSPVRAHAT